MCNEAYKREPQQRVVLFLTTPTQTASIFQTFNNRLEPPVITAAAKEPEVSTFVLGTDTCGFTTGSTITCDIGNECINIDSYRGCCAAGATDCSATIYTNCLDYAEMPNGAMCGPQTLCCPLSKAYCATYGFMTEEQPGAIFTHLRCAELPDFGELYAYPPEQGTTTEVSSVENTSSTLAVDPVESTNSSPSHSISSGAIAGAAIGGIIFLLLAILGISQFIGRRRRQRKKNIGSGGGSNNVPDLSTENSGFGNRVSAGRLPSLSMIYEQQTHSSLSTSPRDKRRSVSSMLRRSSFGPNWPLGPINPGSPLSSHPILDLEKRLNLGDSPRLSYAPPLTIDAAFEEEAEGTLNGMDEPGTSALDKTETSSSVAPLLTAAASSPEVAGTAVTTNNKRLIEHGLYINDGRRKSGPDREPVSPLSPPYQDNDTRWDQPSSFVSAQSISYDKSREQVEASVSPINLDETEGQVSPVTVSPLESRRSSFCVS
ncbi:hypothetical protein F4782DRAFT_549116 [Xylaria castorea]|nr:hypothetical protein F4782DRAFT_549116 [Xylaria castorea]